MLRIESIPNSGTFYSDFVLIFLTRDKRRCSEMTKVLFTFVIFNYLLCSLVTNGWSQWPILVTNFISADSYLIPALQCCSYLIILQTSVPSWSMSN